MFKRKCSHCNVEFQYEGCANMIIFCPHCRKYEYMECEYGYGPVVKCSIFLGTEIVALVTRTGLRYQYDSEKYNVHIILKNEYLKALEEARDITSSLLKTE